MPFFLLWHSRCSSHSFWMKIHFCAISRHGYHAVFNLADANTSSPTSDVGEDKVVGLVSWCCSFSTPPPPTSGGCRRKQQTGNYNKQEFWDILNLKYHMIKIWNIHHLLKADSETTPSYWLNQGPLRTVPTFARPRSLPSTSLRGGGQFSAYTTFTTIGTCWLCTLILR